MSKEEAVNTLKLSPRELEQIAADLNRANNQSAARSKRRLKRWSLQQQKVILTIVHPNDTKTHGVAMPRNISKKGAAVLYGCFVHPGSRCFLSLRCVDGTTQSVAATIVHCRHVKGRLHDLGLAFETAVNPRDFFIVLGNDYLFNREHVEIRGMQGKLLIADGSLATQRLLAHDLRQADLNITYARTGAEAVDCMSDDPQLVLADHALPDMDGIALVHKVREQGYTIPIVLMTAEKDKELRLAAIGAGASEMLYKPIATDLLHRAVAEYLAPDEEILGTNTVQASTEQGKFSNDDLLAYVEELGEIARVLGETLEKGDTDSARARVLELTSTACQFGFEAVGTQASEVLRLLETAGGIQRAASELRLLIRICERAKVPSGG
jgi:CheY-like chemotaxis protein